MALVQDSPQIWALVEKIRDETSSIKTSVARIDERTQLIREEVEQLHRDHEKIAAKSGEESKLREHVTQRVDRIYSVANTLVWVAGACGAAVAAYQTLHSMGIL